MSHYPRNHRDTIPFIAHGEQEAQRQASNRIHAAMLLAKTPEAWLALIRDEPIPTDQLDQSQLGRIRRRIGT